MAAECTVLAGEASKQLAQAVGRELGTEPAPCVLDRFPDGELHVELTESVRGRDVYILQATAPPVHEHLMELLLLADACRRSGAARVTAVMPYFGYARQDRRAHGREALGARVAADVLAAAGVQAVVAVDLHAAAIEGFFGVPLEHLNPLPLFVDALRPQIPGHAIVVSPDLGGVRRAEAFAGMLGLPLAILHKTRLTPSEVSVGGIVGQVRGKAPIIVDDMISSGGTIEAACKALELAGCAGDLSVVATHPLLVGSAAQRLHGLGIRRLLVSDSIPPPANLDLPIQAVSLVPLLAEAIARLHGGRSLAELATRW